MTTPTPPRLCTMLFVPGDRPDRIPKACRSGADAVVIDLEDAVAESRKSAARAATTEALHQIADDGPVIAVRVNSMASGWAEDDLRVLTPVLRVVDIVMVPMSSDAASVRHVAELLDAAEAATLLVPLIETAAGVMDARGIAAAHRRVLTLAFGPADLAHELGVTPTSEGLEFLSARSQLVLAAAAAGRPPPIDGPYLDLEDSAGLARSATLARQLGFGGKQVIHPRQVQIVRDVFAVDAEQLRWAREVDQAFADAERRGVSSIRLPDGSFVDYPVARRARRLLAEHDPGGRCPGS